MTALYIIEEALADGESALFDDGIQAQQDLTQGLHLRQIGHLGALPERGQLLQQGGQLLALGRMLTPAAQQVFCVQQNIHAFGEKQRNHARIARLACIVLLAGTRLDQSRLMQRMHLGQERGGPFDRCQRFMVEIDQPLPQQRLGLVQQLGFRQVHLDQVGLEFLDHLFQRRRDFRNGQDAGHVRTALEGVQRALQCIGHRLGQALRAICEKADERGQVRLCLVAKDFQQLRVQRIVIVFRQNRLRRFGDRCGLWVHVRQKGLDNLSDGLRQRYRLPLGQRMCGGGQSIDIVTLALRLGGELLDQRWHQLDDVTHHLPDRIAGDDGAIQDAIEQVLDGPCEFADDQRPHHPSAALEGVECTADFTQCILVITVGEPARQVFADGFQDFSGLFDEDFKQVFIDRLLVGRRRQEAWRNILRRRIDGGNRRGHHLLQADCRLGFDNGSCFGLREVRQGHFGKVELGNLRHAPVLQARLLVRRLGKGRSSRRLIIRQTEDDLIVRGG